MRDCVEVKSYVDVKGNVEGGKKFRGVEGGVKKDE